MNNLGYKETPIGRIPEDWKVVRLGDGSVAEISYETVSSVINIQQ
jgi:hypothetical protein